MGVTVRAKGDLVEITQDAVSQGDAVGGIVKLTLSEAILVYEQLPQYLDEVRRNTAEARQRRIGQLRAELSELERVDAARAVASGPAIRVGGR